METFNFDGSAVKFIPANLSLHANIRKVMHHFLGRIAFGFKIELTSEAIRSVENSYKSKKKRSKDRAQILQHSRRISDGNYFLVMWLTFAASFQYANIIHLMIFSFRKRFALLENVCIHIVAFQGEIIAIYFIALNNFLVTG